MDAQSFQSAVEEYGDRVYALALRITGSEPDAEDTVQEAFLIALQSWSTFRGEARFSTWLYRIAVNEALARVRARQPATYLSDEALSDLSVRDWSADVEAQALRSELRAQVQQGLDLLDPDLRTAVVLRDVEGFSTAEAAAILDVTEAALKTRLHRGRLLLRRYLDEFLANP